MRRIADEKPDPASWWPLVSLVPALMGLGVAVWGTFSQARAYVEVDPCTGASDVPWSIWVAILAMFAMTVMCAAVLVAVATRGPFTRASAAVAAFAVPGLWILSDIVLIAPFGWHCQQW